MTEKVKIVTLGCEKNLGDSEIMSGLMDALMEEMPESDGIVGTGDFYNITLVVDEALKGRKPIQVVNPVFNYEENLPYKLTTSKYASYVKFAEGCDNNPKICKYVDMPLQHSSDAVLKRMRRPGRNRDTRELIAKIRDRTPGVSLRTSLMVGFPGESEEDFQHLNDFVREVKFDRLGVFTYSKEEDTPASRLPDQADIGEMIKDRITHAHEYDLSGEAIL